MIKVTDANEDSGGVAKISIPNVDENKRITQLFIKNKNTSEYLGSNGWESNVIAIVIEQDERQQYQEGQNKIIKIGPPLVDKIEPHCPIEIIIADINKQEELLWPDIIPFFEGLVPPFTTTTTPGLLPPPEPPPNPGSGTKPNPPPTEEKKQKPINNYLMISIFFIVGIIIGWIINEILYSPNKKINEEMTSDVSRLKDEISDLKVELNEAQSSEDLLSKKIVNLNEEKDEILNKILNLENQLKELNKNELKQLKNLINLSFSKSPDWIFSNNETRSPNGKTEDEIIEEMQSISKDKNKGTLFYKYSENLKKDNSNDINEINFWLKKSASHGNQMARLNLGVNLLIDENSNDEKVWYALQLLKSEIASGSSSKTLPKMIINQVNEKICDKLKLLDYGIEQEVIDLWCN